MEQIKNRIYGILLCLVLAVPAWYLGQKVNLVGGPIFGILLGIIFSYWKRPAYFDVGIRYTSKKILQYSVILLGFTMNLLNVLQVGGQSLVVILFTVCSCLISAYLFGRVMKINSTVTTLIGVGTCICGGSAIAATAPVIQAADDDVTYAISTIFLFNIIGAFLFPALGRLMNMSDFAFGIWAGTAINDTSSVVAASYSFSDAAGSVATIVKLTRTLLIIPITLFLAFNNVVDSKNSNKNSFSLGKIFPWFVIGFITTAGLATFKIVPHDICSILGKIAKFCIVWAMVAIGLNANPRNLIKNGWRPILLGMTCWVVIAVVSLVVQNITGIL